MREKTDGEGRRRAGTRKWLKWLKFFDSASTNHALSLHRMNERLCPGSSSVFPSQLKCSGRSPSPPTRYTLDALLLFQSQRTRSQNAFGKSECPYKQLPQWCDTPRWPTEPGRHSIWLARCSSFAWSTMYIGLADRRIPPRWLVCERTADNYYARPKSEHTWKSSISRNEKRRGRSHLAEAYMST